MEVILREHVDNLGKRGDVVKVAEGYARNYLLPRKLALAVTETLAQRISALEIEIARRVGENDTLYGSVTSADIAQALQTKGFEIEKKRIHLGEPLKALGETTVPVKVHREVTAQLRVKVVPE